jgi:hypothetical protein
MLSDLFRKADTLISKLPLLPDGRIFGQITPKRPQKIVHGRKKLEAVKWQNLAKIGKKRPENIFYKYLDKKPYNNRNFFRFL